MLKIMTYLVVAGVMAASTLLTTAGPVQAMSPSNNSRRIVFTNGLDGHVVSIQSNGSDRRDYGPGYYPTQSPDGKRIAFSRDNADFSARDLYVVHTDGTNLQKVSERVYTPGSLANHFSWAPDSTKLVFTVESGSTDPQAGSEYKQIYTAKTDGGNRQQLTHDATGIDNINPVWSPNGKYILYQRNRDLYTMNANGTTQRQVVANAMSGSWASDSRKILFNETNVGVRTAKSDGSNRITLSALGAAARWSPDNKKIVMEAPACDCPADPLSIITINPDGSDKTIVATPPTAGTVQHPVWSPDSKAVAFVQFARYQPTQLIVKSLAGGDGTVIITERVAYPEWATLSRYASTPPHFASPWDVVAWVYHWLEKIWR